MLSKLRHTTRRNLPHCRLLDPSHKRELLSSPLQNRLSFSVHHKYTNLGTSSPYRRIKVTNLFPRQLVGKSGSGSEHTTTTTTTTTTTRARRMSTKITQLETDNRPRYKYNISTPMRTKPFLDYTSSVSTCLCKHSPKKQRSEYQSQRRLPPVNQGLPREMKPLRQILCRQLLGQEQGVV